MFQLSGIKATIWHQRLDVPGRKLGSKVGISGLLAQYLFHLEVGEITHWSDHHWSDHFRPGTSSRRDFCFGGVGRVGEPRLLAPLGSRWAVFKTLVGCLGYRGSYTTHLYILYNIYGDFTKPIYNRHLEYIVGSGGNSMPWLLAIDIFWHFIHQLMVHWWFGLWFGFLGSTYGRDIGQKKHCTKIYNTHNINSQSTIKSHRGMGLRRIQNACRVSFSGRCWRIVDPSC